MMTWGVRTEIPSSRDEARSVVISKWSARIRRGGAGRLNWLRWMRAAAVVIASTFLPPAGGVSAMAASFDFSVLSYNVHGLPGIVSRDGPARRMRAIGELTNEYDVVLLQETFANRGVLLTQSVHGIVVVGNGAKFPLWPILAPFCGSCGAGLTALLRYPSERLVAKDREPFGVCAGWLGGANDCFANKGFIRLRARLRDGVQVDFYDLHLDAGRDDASGRARDLQLVKLEGWIWDHSRDVPVVIGGDFNMRDDDRDDMAILHKFQRHLGLERAYFPPSKNDSGWPPVDYILYRDGGARELDVLRSGIDPKFVLDGAALSDHPAVFAVFRVQRGERASKPILDPEGTEISRLSRPLVDRREAVSNRSPMRKGLKFERRLALADLADQASNPSPTSGELKSEGSAPPRPAHHASNRSPVKRKLNWVSSFFKRYKRSRHQAGSKPIPDEEGSEMNGRER